MAAGDEVPISMLRRHCRMYLWGESASRSPLLDEDASDFISFAGMHLICTMFITTDRRGEAGGVFHRVLDPLDQSDLLKDVDHALGLPIGRTTLRQYLRSKRNKLGTHGSLAFSSHSPAAQEVIMSDEALDQFQDAIDSLTAAVRVLNTRLRELEAQNVHP